MKKYFPLTTIIICIIGIFVSFKCAENSGEEKVDYLMILTKDYRIIIKDLKGEVIYSDTTNFSNPSKIEQALIDDNL